MTTPADTSPSFTLTDYKLTWRRDLDGGSWTLRLVGDSGVTGEAVELRVDPDLLRDFGWALIDAEGDRVSAPQMAVARAILGDTDEGKGK